MTTPIEERLRAHLADVAARDRLPGSDTSTAFTAFTAFQQSRDEAGTVPRRWSDHAWPVRPAMIAAAVLVVCLVVGLLAVNRDGDAVRTGPGTDPTNPQPTTPTTVPDASGGPTATPPATAGSSTTAAPPPESTTSVVVGPSGPLGWWDGSSWRAPDSGDLPVSGDEEYTIVGLDPEVTTGTGGWGDGCGISEPPGSVVEVALPQDDDWRTPTPMAVTGVENPRPRPVRRLATSNEVYQAAAAEVLAGLGIDDAEPEVVQAIAADLDGDGTDEVVVVVEQARDTADNYGGAGDYSVAFVRQVVDGAVTTATFQVSLGRDTPELVPPRDMDVVRVAAIADFNGDGRMEIGTELHFWEGSTMAVHELAADGAIRKVLNSTC